MQSERETALLGLRSAANKLRASLSMIPDDAQQLSFQLSTFAQYCGRLQLPGLTQARKASTSLATLAEVLEAVAPDVMKYAKLLQKHSDAALSRSKADITMKEQVARCVGYATSLEDCGRMTLDSKTVAKLLSDAESCELSSGLTSPLEMLQGILDTCSKISNLPERVHDQLAEVEEEMPEHVSSFAEDYPKLTAFAERLDDIVSQIVAAAVPLHLDERQVTLAVSGVDAVGRALTVLKELPRVVEPLVEKLDIVGEVISMGSRAARDLSHGVKRRVRAMHTDSVTSIWARRVMHRLRRGLRAARDARDAADFSWAPCVIVSFYVLGLATGVAGVILFTAALVKGLGDHLPSLGVAGVVCFIVGVSSCVFGVGISFVLRAIARVGVLDVDEEQREFDQAVREIKQARRERQRPRSGEVGSIADGEAHVESKEGGSGSPERLIFGDSDKGLVAEMQALGANVMYAEDVLSAGKTGSAGHKHMKKGNGGEKRPGGTKNFEESETTKHQMGKANVQEVLQDLFVEGQSQTRKTAEPHRVERGGGDAFSQLADMGSHAAGGPMLPVEGEGQEGGPQSSAVLLMNLMGDSGVATPAARSQQRQSASGGGFTAQTVSQPSQVTVRASAEELTQYARYLGMDPVFDADLLWIAEQAYYAPLPTNWEEAADGDGNIYYFNAMTSVTTWSHPLEDHFRSLFLQMKGDKSRVANGKGKAASSGDPFNPTGARLPTRHLPDDAEAGDYDDGSNDGLHMGRSSMSVRGRDQPWELSAGKSTSTPFIRSYGTSADLGSSLAAARAVQPPPLPTMLREADTASAPMHHGKGGKARGARGSSVLAASSTSLAIPALPPIAGPSGNRSGGSWMPQPPPKR